ncbi:MAG: Hsp33 family molecular chaperone HslO [Planctomycetes bacterium]|nr:Hsp33 family molecular chaperone HslO [Planctomycetota bacterium]
MKEVPGLGEARLQRFIDEARSAIFVHGDFGAFFRGYRNHARRWDREPDPLAATLMQQGLAAAALYLSCRPRDESVGWTLSIKEPAISLFLTGEAGRSTVTGRLLREGVRQFEKSRLYVQAQRERGPIAQTFLDFTSLDVLEIFEQYYARSDQHPARFFEYSDVSFGMILALPGADLTWLQSLTREAARERTQALRKKLDTRVFRFACGCSVERMREVARGAYPDPRELFAGESRIEVQCPRCGHSWWLTSEMLR